MTGNFKECLALVLKSEGGWTGPTGLKGDPGGETNLGVTKRVWEEWVGHPVETMKNLTEADVAPLYEQKYWRPCYGEVLPRGLDYLCFSFGVNAGCGRSVKLLQQSLGLVSDGVIGPKVMQKLRESNIADVIKGFSESRREYYKSLKTFPIFGKGWLSRVDHEETQSLNMVKNG
jgi:lysozyme family protein